MLESVFRNSRYLVFIIILSSFCASLLLYVTAVNIMLQAILGFFADIPDSATEAKVMAVMLLKSLDILLIALVFQIVSIAHYRFFISAQPDKESRFLKVMHVNDFHDLKIILLQVSILILPWCFWSRQWKWGQRRKPCISRFQTAASLLRWSTPSGACRVISAHLCACSCPCWPRKHGRPPKRVVLAGECSRSGDAVGHEQLIPLIPKGRPARASLCTSGVVHCNAMKANAASAPPTIGPTHGIHA